MKRRVEAFEDLEVYRLAEEVGDRVWDLVLGWDNFAKYSMGSQMTRSADSIGANIAEGFGRFHFAENKQFNRIARGSLYETRHWIRRANKRNMISKEKLDLLNGLLNELSPRLNAYIRSIGSKQKNPSQ